MPISPDSRESRGSESSSFTNPIGSAMQDRLSRREFLRRSLMVGAGAVAAAATGGLPGLLNTAEASSTTKTDGTDILGTPEPENPAKTAIEKALKVSSKDLFNVSNSFRWELDAFNGIMVQDPLMWIDSTTKDFVYPTFIDGGPVQIPDTMVPYYFARKDNRNEFMPHKGIVTYPGKETRGENEAFSLSVSVIPVAREVKSLDTGDPNADPVDVDILYGLLHSGGKKLILPFAIGYKNLKTGKESGYGGYGEIRSATRGIKEADQGASDHTRDEALAIIDENLESSTFNLTLGTYYFADDYGREDEYPPLFTSESLTRKSKKTENLYKALADRDMKYVETSEEYTAYGLDNNRPQEPQPTEVPTIYTSGTQGTEVPHLPGWKQVNGKTTITLDELLDTIPQGGIITYAPSNYSLFP